MGIREAHVPCWFPSNFLANVQQTGLLGRKESSSLPLHCYLLLWPVPGSVAKSGLYSGYHLALFLIEKIRECEGNLCNLNDRRWCDCSGALLPPRGQLGSNWNCPLMDPGRCGSLILAVCWACGGCVTVCAGLCQFSGLKQHGEKSSAVKISPNTDLQQ